MLEAHQLMFTMPDNQPLENLAEPKIGLAAFEEQLPGSEAVGEQTVMVKVEPNGDFRTLGQAGPGNGTGAPDKSQLWTSGIETSGDTAEQTICVLSHDVKYHIGPAAGAAYEQQGYTSPIKDLPFLDDKEKEEMMHGDQYSVIGMQSRSSDMTRTSELQDEHITHEVAVNNYIAVSDRTQGGTAFDLNMSGSSKHKDNCGSDATGQNCFICSSCRQSFDSFSLFQRHQCKNITEQS